MTFLYWGQVNLYNTMQWVKGQIYPLKITCTNLDLFFVKEWNDPWENCEGVLHSP